MPYGIAKPHRYNALYTSDVTNWVCVDFSSVRSSNIHLRAISQEMPQPQKLDLYSKLLIWNESFE